MGKDCHTAYLSRAIVVNMSGMEMACAARGPIFLAMVCHDQRKVWHLGFVAMRATDQINAKAGIEEGIRTGIHRHSRGVAEIHAQGLGYASSRVLVMIAAFEGSVHKLMLGGYHLARFGYEVTHCLETLAITCVHVQNVVGSLCHVARVIGMEKVTKTKNDGLSAIGRLVYDF